MSFSSGFKDRNANPAVAWIEFGKVKDEAGNKPNLPSFYRYDKSTKTNVEVDLSKGFIVLDPFLMKVVGYNKKFQRNVFSNEVKSAKDDIIKVVSYLQGGQKHTYFEGTYKELKESDRMEGIGAKYCQSIYIAIDPSLLGLHMEDGLVIANISASGGLFEAWLNMVQPKDGRFKLSVFSSRYIQTKAGVYHPKTRGDVHYHIPEFEVGGEISEDDRAWATQLDLELQDYLDRYLAKGSDYVEADQDINQETGYDDADQSQEVDEDQSYLGFKLKDGSTVGSKDLDELQGMLEYLDKNKVNPSRDIYVAITKTIEFKKKNNPQKAKNPFAIEEDEDDIPF